MWKERGTRVSLTIASQLVEMRVRKDAVCARCCLLTHTRAQDFGAAARFLEPLCQHGEASPALRSAIARIYLQGGHLGAASQHLAAVEADPSADDITKDMNRAMEAAAYGHWDMAIQALERVLQVDPDDALVRLAVTSVFCWK
jgi:thioredoxin-like negative regulator of GroEL